MPSQRVLTRIAAAGAVAVFLAVLLLLSGPDTPGWIQSAAGGFAKVACAVIALVVTYVLLLLVGMGLVRGERVKRFSLRNFEFEFADEAEGLKEIDVRLTSDMKALTQLVTDLAERVDEIDEQTGLEEVPS